MSSVGLGATLMGLTVQEDWLGRGISCEEDLCMALLFLRIGTNKLFLNHCGIFSPPRILLNSLVSHATAITLKLNSPCFHWNAVWAYCPPTPWPFSLPPCWLTVLPDLLSVSSTLLSLALSVFISSSEYLHLLNTHSSLVSIFPSAFFYHFHMLHILPSFVSLTGQWVNVLFSPILSNLWYSLLYAPSFATFCISILLLACFISSSALVLLACFFLFMLSCTWL